MRRFRGLQTTVDRIDVELKENVVEGVCKKCGSECCNCFECLQAKGMEKDLCIRCFRGIEE